MATRFTASPTTCTTRVRILSPLPRRLLTSFSEKGDTTLRSILTSYYFEDHGGLDTGSPFRGCLIQGYGPGAADVAVTLDVVPGVPHVFQAFAAIR